MIKPSIRSTPRLDPVDIALMAVDSLQSNKLRTGLTMLGMVIGIASVITITSVGEGTQRSTEQQLEALGTNVLTIRAGAARSSWISQGAGSATTLTWDDAQAIATQTPSVAAAAAFLQQPVQIVYGNQNYQTTAIGTEPTFPEIRNFNPQLGRFFTETEVKQFDRVVVIGSTVWHELWGEDDPIGDEIRIQGQPFQVIGVLETKGSTGPINQDDQIVIPLSTLSQRFVGTNALAGVAVQGVWVQARDQLEMEAAEFQITNLLRLRHDIYPPEPDDFSITSQADLISTFTSVLGTLTLMVGAIGSISLLVGGIGIANIMLVSVIERTREIGIRKAVGATRQAILSQFLVESILIALIGGGTGIVLGIVCSSGTAAFLSLPLVISNSTIMTGFGLSALVGLLAGILPARRAAYLDPIAALRSE